MIRKLRATSALMAAASLTCSTACFANSYSNATIGQIQVDNRPCVFFWLHNVALADPAVPGQGWFSLPKSGANYQEMLAELISSKLTGKSLHVSTDGSVSCGFATAALIGIED